MPLDIRLIHIEFKSAIQTIINKFTNTSDDKIKNQIGRLEIIVNTIQTGTELWETVHANTQQSSSSAFLTQIKKSLQQFPKEQLMQCDLELLQRYNNLRAINYQKLLVEYQSLQISFNSLQRNVDKFTSLEDINSWQKLEIDNQQLKNHNALLQKENDLLAAKINELQQSISQKFQIIEQKQLQQREEITRLYDNLQDRDTTIEKLQQQLAAFRPNLSRNSASHFKTSTQHYVNNPRMENQSAKEQF